MHALWHDRGAKGKWSCLVDCPLLVQAVEGAGAAGEGGLLAGAVDHGAAAAGIASRVVLDAACPVPLVPAALAACT